MSKKPPSISFKPAGNNNPCTTIINGNLKVKGKLIASGSSDDGDLNVDNIYASGEIIAKNITSNCDIKTKTITYSTETIDITGQTASGDIAVTWVNTNGTGVLDDNGITGYHEGLYKKVIKINDGKFAEWKTTYVTQDTNTDLGEYSSLIIDNDGYPIVTFFDDTSSNEALVFARSLTKDGLGGWTSVIIDSVNEPGEFGTPTSLKISQDGYPIVSYYNYDASTSKGDLRFARSLSTSGIGGWTSTIVDNSTNIVGKWNSLELDINGFPIISYADNTFGQLKFARSSTISGTSTSDWSTNDIIGPVAVNSNTSLKLNRDGLPMISYFDDNSPESLNFTICDNTGGTGTWTNVIVDQITGFGRIGTYSSLALDENNFPIISYYDEDNFSNNDLKFARSSSLTGAPGSWTSIKVDIDGIVGRYTSLILNKDGYPIISYYRSTDSSLNLATSLTKSGIGSWNTEIIDEKNTVGEFTSLALDETNEPIISYHDNTFNELKFAKYYSSIDYILSFNNNTETVALTENGDSVCFIYNEDLSKWVKF